MKNNKEFIYDNIKNNELARRVKLADIDDKSNEYRLSLLDMKTSK